MVVGENGSGRVGRKRGGGHINISGDWYKPDAKNALE